MKKAAITHLESEAFLQYRNFSKLQLKRALKKCKEDLKEALNDNDRMGVGISRANLTVINDLLKN